MAIVHLASQTDLQRHVALKELSRYHAGSTEFVQRFLQESRLTGSLNHPNIVTVFEYFEHESIPYIAMEYVPRGSLRSYAKRLSLAQIAGVLEGVLAGLTHAEQAGIVHRDLKPENIMVTGDGRVKIADFGIARATQRANTRFRTDSGMTVGTPTYMAPEQAMAGDIGPWTDLYSVGVIAYELVVGRVPFHDTDIPMVVLMRQVNEQIPSASSVHPGVDPALSDWIDQLLIKDPKQRTQSAAIAWEQLEEIIVNQLGPLWRRGARLLEDQRAAEGSRPLTPAPFESQPKLPTPAPMPVEAPAGSDPADPGREPEPDKPSGFVTFARRGRQQQPPAPAPTPEPTQAPDPPVPTPETPLPGVLPIGEETLAPVWVEQVDSAAAEAAPPKPEPLEDVPGAHAEPESHEPPSRATNGDTDRSRRRRRGVLAGLALVAAAAVGFLIAPSANKAITTTVPLSRSATAGPLSVSYPAAWSKADGMPLVARSLNLTNAVTLTADKSAPGGALLVGTGSSQTQSLLPSSFLRVTKSVPRPYYVELGGTIFKRYLNVIPNGTTQHESVYVVPTTEGIATAVCVDPHSGAAQFAATCERVVATLKTRGSRLSFGGDPQYARAISSVISKLNDERTSIGAELSSASTPAAQASDGRRLADAYRTAAEAVAKLRPGPVATAANAAIVAALNRLADAYSGLAKAASTHDHVSYRAARQQVMAQARALTHALTELDPAGYSVN